MTHLRAWWADVRANLAAIPVLLRALWRWTTYLAVWVKFLWQLPRMVREIRADMNRMGEYQATSMQMQKETARMAGDLHMRVRHHEHGPLMASRVELNRRRARAVAAATKIETAKTAAERQAAESELAALALMEEESIGEGLGVPDVEIDGRTGQVLTSENAIHTPRGLITRDSLIK